jgi:Low-density lipoprotein receptor domain class A.
MFVTEAYVCPVTHFKCNNHFCIPSDKVCNFVDDCGDGSDENKCCKWLIFRVSLN